MDEIDLLPEEMAREVTALARRAAKVNGPMMRALNALGGKAEAWFAGLPAPARTAFDAGSRQILTGLYTGAGQARERLPDAGAWGHKIAAAASGAAGGSVGLASAMVELPATVMVMFGAMQKAAAEAGFDPEAEEVRLICLDIFGSGAPGPGDDGVNSTFLGARLSLNSATLNAVLARVLPAFSAMLGKTLAAKAVPILGAMAGAGINYAFTDYYQEIARVRFGVMRLVKDHGEEAVHRAFRAEMARLVTAEG
ncbi:EcsC family protein [Frigidibacter sp. SD6-1]|uniref:EcsC family protein n=1 Tax=Frigidibacter sp. SD6-1 TaxID=3032581 RepID=UPI0024DF51E7|nr:EcsC family protein [Frigidibacter sp. SD6-1]